MKSYVLWIVLLVPGISVHGQTSLEYWNDRLDEFLDSHTKKGLVDYQRIAADRAPIHELTAIMRNMEPLSGLEEQAFLINAYNLIVIGEIAKRWPLESVRNIPGFFDDIKHDVGTHRFTLDGLEEYLMDRYDDPRIHLALVCGAASCPPLYRRAFRANALHDQLDESCRRALNDPGFLKMTDSGYQLSKVFQWYQSDFGGRSGIREFIGAYRQDLEQSITVDSYFEHDWSVNAISETNFLQVYTPSFLLNPGQYSAKWFHNLYTQTALFDDGGHRVSSGSSTFYTSILEFNAGFRHRINLGMDAYFRSVLYADSETNPLKVFSFGNSEYRKTALTHLGPSIKVQPFPNSPYFSAELSWLFPITGDLEEEPYLEDDGHQASLQLFYDRSLGNDLQLFVEWGIWNKFDESFRLNKSSLQIPLRVFLNYFLGDRWTIYLNSEFNPTPGKGNLLSSWYLQSGLGSKFLVSDQLEVEILYTNFWEGRNAGAGETFNVGMRYVH